MTRSPIDIATQHTVRFLAQRLSPGSIILEIGCGEGDVALALKQAGHDVTAIDGDEDAVKNAAAKGVNAICATWPHDAASDYDAIIFTRSLHHIHDLDGAISAAKNCLRLNGQLLVEDFAFETADEKTAQWLLESITEGPLAGMLTAPQNSFLGNLLASKAPLDAWRNDHDHDLHSIQKMAAAVSAEFNRCDVELAPYLYRYLIPCLPDAIEVCDLLKTFYEAEKAAIKEGAILPIGRRIIAEKREHPMPSGI